MPNEILLGIFINIASSILYDSGKSILGSIQGRSLLSNAIMATARSFSALEGVEQTLSKWCESKDFSDFLDRLQRGERNFTEDEIVTSFIDLTEFYFEEDTRPQAYKLLMAFAEAFSQEIYGSKHGLGYLASRTEVQYLEQTRAIQGLQQKLETFEQTRVQGLPADSATIPSAAINCALVLSKQRLLWAS